MITLLLALLTATPATAPAQFAAAKCGDSIAMVGTFAAKVTIAARPTCVVPVDASKAVISWIWLNGASNFAFSGGEFANAPYDAFQVTGSDHLEFSGGYYHGFGDAAISLLNASAVSIHDNQFAHAGGDAIDVISSQHVQVRDNRFWDLNYGPAHVDLVQAYSLIGGALTDDVAITGNWGECRCQGFDNFGAGDPRPITNIDVEDNHLATDMVGAISFKGVGGASKMLNNTLMTISTMPKGWGGAQAVMTPAPGVTVTVNGNVNGAAP